MYSDYVARHSLHKISVGGICLRDGEILVVKNTYGVSKGKWTLPGGYVELGETLSNSIEREVFEETGIETRAVNILALRHMVNEKKDRGLISDLYVVFNLEYISGNPTSGSDEISDTRFIDFNKVSKQEISGLSRYIIKNLLSSKDLSLQTYEPEENIISTLNIHEYQLFG